MEVHIYKETRLALAYRFKEFEAEKAKERQLSNLKQFSEQEAVIEEDAVLPLAHQYANGHNEEKDDLKSSKGKTLEIIAQKAGVSTRTAEQYDAIQRKGSEEQKAEVAEGKSSIKKVYTQIQKAERLKTIAMVCLNKARRVGMSKVPYIYDFKSSHLKLRNSGTSGQVINIRG